MSPLPETYRYIMYESPDTGAIHQIYYSQIEDLAQDEYNDFTPAEDMEDDIFYDYCARLCREEEGLDHWRDEADEGYNWDEGV